MKRSLITTTILMASAVTLSACGLFNRGGDEIVADPLPVAAPINPVPIAPIGINPGEAVVPQLTQITGANVSRNPNDPDQLILEVSGNMPNGCSELGPIDYKVFGRTFRYTIPYVENSAGGFCTQALKPFTERYAINGAGQPLAPGAYELDLNGVIQPFNI